MDEVIKKCSHIIEKHGKGKWVDDAYLLMGDAQLFKGDFYTAVEVYEYVAGSFKSSIPAAQAEINLITTYILMGKFDSIIQYFGISFHYDAIKKGVIDTKNIVYFLSVIVFFMFAALTVIKSLKK